jgi:endonuclease G
MLGRLMLSSLLWLGMGAAALAESPHAPFGMPSKAAEKFEDNPEDFLIAKKQFVLSYNSKTGTPNWVAWRLVKDDLGTAKRVPFYPDEALPKAKRIFPKDYKFTDTGMSRGHMCPHSDRSATKGDSKATFAMTNMVPQTMELNAGAWNDLEVYARYLVEKRGKEVYLVAGPAGKGGRSSKGFFTSIAGGKVVVPAHCWKVLLVVDAGDGTPAERAKEGVRMVAVIMPNDTTPTGTWPKYRTTVKEVESLTGLTFFEGLEGAGDLKAETDDQRIPVLPRAEH